MAARKTAEKKPQPRAASGPEPAASRPQIPPEYGMPRSEKGMLPWSHVTDRLASAQHYWICTVSPDGRPHAVPVDGVWLDDRLYFGGAPATRWRRNLSANPAVCVHLESAASVVMLQGDARLAAVNRDLAERLSVASKQKYGYSPTPEEYETTPALAFRPRVAFAWTNMKDATRWRFDEEKLS